MKRLTILFLILVCPFGLAGTTYIGTKTQLEACHSDPTENYVLTNNINMENANFLAYKINDYNGTFDGDGYTISNLYVGSAVWSSGMFGECDLVGATFILQNLTVTNFCCISSGRRSGLIGFLVNQTATSMISNVCLYATNCTYSDVWTGVLVGQGSPKVYDSTIQCDDLTSSALQCGGISGWGSANMRDCVVDITMTPEGTAGLIVGDGSAALYDCTIRGSVLGDSADQRLGFGIGDCGGSAMFSNCTFSGTLTGQSSLGGAIGWFNGTYYARILDCTFKDITMTGEGVGVGISFAAGSGTKEISGCLFSNVVISGSGSFLVDKPYAGTYSNNTVVASTITNITATSGGLAAYNYGAPVFVDNTVSANIFGTTGDRVGGLFGDMQNGTTWTATRCSYSGKMSGPSGANGWGGIVGRASSGTISDCYAVHDNSAVGRGCGGVAGTLEGSAKIINAYSDGTIVSGSGGGFVNLLSSPAIISNCIAVVAMPAGQFEFIGVISTGTQTNNACWDQGLDDIASSTDTVKWEESTLAALYDASHSVYDPWDFTTPDWYEWSTNMPLFTAEPVGPVSTTWRRRVICN